MDLLTNPIMLGGIFCVVIVLVVFLLIKRMHPSHEVLFLRERDRRGETLGISEESATKIVCKSKRKTTKRFFKWGGAYVFNEKGKMVTRYLAKEGTAYTYKPYSSEKVSKSNVPSSTTETVQCIHCGETFDWDLPIVQIKDFIGERLGTLKEALETVWGKKFYEELPEKLQQKIEENKILVTVELEQGLTPRGYSPVSEDEIEEEADREAAKIFGEGLGATVKQQLYTGMLWMALGVALTFIAYNIGIFK
jgi:hypothetical protein